MFREGAKAFQTCDKLDIDRTFVNADLEPHKDANSERMQATKVVFYASDKP